MTSEKTTETLASAGQNNRGTLANTSKRALMTLKIIVFFAAFALAANSNLMAQSAPPCPNPKSWDYPNILYSGSVLTSVILSVNPPCVLHYYYCWRTTPMFYDFVICQVTMEGTGCNNSLTVDSLIKYAARDLVTNVNPWRDDSTGQPEIPECPQMSSRYWRQSTAACFTDYYWNPANLTWTSWPCEDQQERWCWTSYQFCWKWVNGNKVLEERIIGYEQGGASCPPEFILEPIYFPPLKCNSRCQ